MIIVFFVPYTASGFVACGKLFHGLMGFDYTTAMIVSAAVIVAYTSTGGFMAASVTSLVQSLVMTATLVIVVVFGINAAGGWDQVAQNAKEIPGYVDMFTVYPSESLRLNTSATSISTDSMRLVE